MKCIDRPDNPRMDNPKSPANQAAPTTHSFSEAQTGKGDKTPSLMVSGGRKPTRAERRDAAKLQRKVVEVQEIAESGVPAAFRGVASAASGVRTESAENQPAPSLPSVSLLPTAQSRKDDQTRIIDQLRGQSILGQGRPSEYTDDEADTICSWVMEGGSLRAYCRQTGRASKTVYQWMRENASFSARYIRACEDRADSLTDDMLEIGDDAGLNPTIEGVAAAKLRVETRKWIASKLRPQKWGDKQVVEHVGAVSIRIGIPQKPAITVVEQVERLD